MKTFRKVSGAILILFLTLVLGFLAIRWFMWAPTREMEQKARAMIGRPESELLGILGPPRYIVSADSLDGKTVDYPWKGMNYIPVPDHPVRNKVLLYSKMNVAFYIYVDERGIVEYVTIAET